MKIRDGGPLRAKAPLKAERIRLSLPTGEGRVRVGGVDLSSVWNPSPPAFAVLRRGRQSSLLAAREEAGRNAEILSDFYTYGEL